MGLHNSPNEFGARGLAQENPALPSAVSIGSPFVSRWRISAGLVFTLFLVLLIAFRQTVAAMVSTWYSSRTFSHCFLVFPLSAYLVWRRRKQLAELNPMPNLWGLLPVALLSILWVLGNLGEIRLVEEWVFVGILVSLIWTLLGSTVLRKLDLPLAFLIFAVPFGLGLIGPLQDVTAWFAIHALTLSRVPAVLENRVLSVPNATWTVAEACSGIRYLFSSVMLGVIYACIMYRTRKRRLLFMCASVLVPIFANGLRAYGIVLLAYVTNNRLAADVDHVVYGWVFFTVVQLALFVVGMRWRETFSLEEAPSPIPSERSIQSPSSLRTTLIAASMAAMLIALAPPLAERLWSRATANAGLAEWPETPVSVSEPWHATPTYDTSWAPDLRDTNRGFVQSYVSGQHRVDLFWALHSGQRGFELLSSYNRVANPKLWSLVAENYQDEIVDGKQISVRRSLIGSGSASRSIWTWYWVNGEYTGSSTRVKLLQVKSRLLGASSPTCVLVVATDSAEGPSSAESVLRDFLTHTSFLAHNRPAEPGVVVSSGLTISESVHKVSR